ncbi:MAG: sigma-70 family RNA polymerase sigma factor [Bacteroidota bacterium]
MQNISDDQILQLVGNPDSLEKGFRLLMQKYQERVYWQIRRLVVEHEDANDVIQNTFIKVFKNIGSFEGKSQLYTWLYRIATNEAITFLNKKKRKAASSLDDEEALLANRLEADTYFDGDKAQRMLQMALATLPEKQRLVFHMRYYDEMSYKDISEVLGTSVGGLKASYHHAAKKIENYLRGTESNGGGA